MVVATGDVHVQRKICDFPAALVFDILAVLVPVLVTAVSISADTLASSRKAYSQYFSSSTNHVVVIGVSPVALSILISSPHCEARGVVVVVQAVQ